MCSTATKRFVDCAEDEEEDEEKSQGDGSGEDDGFLVRC